MQPSGVILHRGKLCVCKCWKHAETYVQDIELSCIGLGDTVMWRKKRKKQRRNQFWLLACLPTKGLFLSSHPLVGKLSLNLTKQVFSHFLRDHICHEPQNFALTASLFKGTSYIRICSKKGHSGVIDWDSFHTNHKMKPLYHQTIVAQQWHKNQFPKVSSGRLRNCNFCRFWSRFYCLGHLKLKLYTLCIWQLFEHSFRHANALLMPFKPE